MPSRKHNWLVGVRRLAERRRIFMGKSKNSFRCTLLNTGGISKASCSTVFRIILLGTAYLLALIVSKTQFIAEYISKPQKSLLRKSKQGDIYERANLGAFSVMPYVTLSNIRSASIWGLRRSETPQFLWDITYLCWNIPLKPQIQ